MSLDFLKVPGMQLAKPSFQGTALEGVINQQFQRMQEQLDNLSDSSSDLSEDLFRDVEVFSSDEDPDEKIGEFDLFDEFVFKNVDGEEMHIGEKGQVLEKMKSLKKQSTFLSRQKSLRSANDPSKSMA